MTTLGRLGAAGAAIAILMAPAAGSAQRPQVIVETDMGGDSDDAAMVAFVHHLADIGAVDLLAVMHNGNNDWGGAAISAVNTYYGRPDIPIGTYRTAAEAGRPDYHPPVDPWNPNGPRLALSYTGPTLEGHWVRLLAENFPCRYQRRLSYPDAVDVYRLALSRANDGAVVIVNGGFLGNLSNLVARFDAEPSLAALFQRKVARMTGAVGGVNTCDYAFPQGMAEHVLENRRWPTTLIVSLGAPVLDPSAVSVGAELGARMPIDHPVREAYRYKTEVEHGNRGTSQAWGWHMFDVVTAFSTIAWDQLRNTRGEPFFVRQGPGWLDVRDNCSAQLGSGAPPAWHLRFESVGLNVPPGSSLAQASADLGSTLREALYAPPLYGSTVGRDPLAVTALFEDGTFGGLDYNGGNGGTHVANGRVVSPANANIAFSGAKLLVESRRYFDQTMVARIAALPRVDQFAPWETTEVGLDYYFFGDARNTTEAGFAPRLRFVAWPGRGSTGPGRPVYRCEVWDRTGSGYAMLAGVDVPGLAAGAPVGLRVEVAGRTVQATVNGVPVFAAPIWLWSAPPSDGGLSQLALQGACPSGTFELEYVLLRAHSGSSTDVDVYFDKRGTPWFSYVANGDLPASLLDPWNGLRTHIVDMSFAPRSGWGGPIFVRFPWDDGHPQTIDWSGFVSIADLEGAGMDHWVYGLPGIPWQAGDVVALEFRGNRETERAPITF